VEMSGKSQEDVVSYLRSIKFGSVVNIIVSRADADRHQVPPSSTVVIPYYWHITSIRSVRNCDLTQSIVEVMLFILEI